MKAERKPEAQTEAKFTENEQKSALRIFWGNIRRTNREAAEGDKIKFLKRIPFFEDLKKHELNEVAQVIYEREYREGEYIFEIGQPGASLFIVQTGEISVEISSDTHDTTQLAVLGKHAFVGELALLDEAPRSASARAMTSTKVFALFRKDLHELATVNPDITSKIYRSLATIIGNRLKATNELIERKLKAVA
jgi:CRP-like cAMP-binding protein